MNIEPYKARKAGRRETGICNNLLLSAIENAGYKRQADFSRATGIRANDISALVSMRESPINHVGRFTEAARTIMEALGAAPADLWTAKQLYLDAENGHENGAIASSKRYIALMTHHLIETTEATNVLPDPAQKVEQNSERIAMERLMDDLSPRLRFVLRARFGFDTGIEQTLEEVGRQLDVSPERIRQIEMKALRILRRRIAQEKPACTEKVISPVDPETEKPAITKQPPQAVFVIAPTATTSEPPIGKGLSAIAKVLNTLPELMRAALRLRYGLWTGQPESREFVAQWLGVPVAAIIELEQQALKITLQNQDV